jgi:hypothetical protein
VIACLGFAGGSNTVVDHQHIAARVLLLAAIFASGYFEAVVLKSRDLACTTWFICLGALTAWIAYSWTTASILAGAVVFATGLILLIVYYRSWKTDAGKPTG